MTAEIEVHSSNELDYKGRCVVGSGQWVIDINSLTLKDVPDHLKTPEMCQKAVEEDLHCLEFVPDKFKTAEMCEKVVDIYPPALIYVPDALKTVEMCQRAIEDDSDALAYVPDWFIPSISDPGCCDSCDADFDDLFKLYEQRKALKTAIHREILHIAWHPDRVVDWCFDEDEKKDL